MTNDRRAHPRLRIMAEVQVRGQEVATLPVINASLGGVLLEADAAEVSWMVPGAVCELLIFPHRQLEGEPEEVVSARGRVLRRDPGDEGRLPGIGVRFESIDSENQVRLRALLARAGRE